MKLDHYSYSGTGGRENNEDAIGLKLRDGRGIFIVADGLGGYGKGELASACVIETVLKKFGDDEGKGADIAESLALANENILKLQEEHRAIMKSTAVVLSIDDDTATWGHVGDSRLYYIHDGKISYITHDHSVAYKKYAAGEIKRSEIGKDDDQPTLLRALGSRDRYETELCSEPVTLGTGDAFMLCTDGLWTYLQDDEVLYEYLRAEDAKDWGSRLLERVNKKVDGSNDNLSLITVIVN